jgi:hypothetical protein
VKQFYRIIFPIGRKNLTGIFDLGMFPPFGPFGRNSPTHCFKWGFSQTVSWKISVLMDVLKAVLVVLSYPDGVMI